MVLLYCSMVTSRVLQQSSNVQVLRERYADEHAIGVIGWLELDAKVINEQMIAKLVMSGTSL